MEAMVGNAHHIEVQLIADGQGQAWAAGVRDCSCQRRHQKVIEESSSVVLTREQEEEVKEASRRLALESGYRNAGTVEFLYEPDEKRFSFMEVNARLQVEHPVTEAVTGLDLVKLQLHVAAGGKLEGEPPEPVGHAIEARLNAEDPAMGFSPTPGRVQVLDLASGPGVRVDRGIAAGDVIPPDFDSMVAKVIAYGRTREEAIARLRRALRESTAIDRGRHDQPRLPARDPRPPGVQGRRGRHRLAGPPRRVRRDGGRRRRRRRAAAGRDRARRRRDRDRARLLLRLRPPRPPRGQRAGLPRRRGPPPRPGLPDRRLPARARPLPRRRRRHAVEAEVERLSGHERRITIDGVTHRTMISRQGADLLVEVHGVPHRITRDDGGFVRSQGPSVVVAIPVTEGDEVAEGDVVAVVESMKMETSLTAPFAGRVRRVLTGTNVQVPAHTPLLQLEAIEDEAAEQSAERVSFADVEAATEGGPRPRSTACAGCCSATTSPATRSAARSPPCATLRHRHLIAGEHRLLDVFTDVRALSRARHDDRSASCCTARRSTCTRSCARSTPRPSGCPSASSRCSSARSSHYGVDSLDRTPALEDACYRLFVSQERADLARAAVMAILERRLERADELVGPVGDEFRGVLDRLELATERRDPVIADQARQLRNRYFDQPVIAERQAQAYAELERHLEGAAGGPGPRRPRGAHPRRRRGAAAARAAAHRPHAATPARASTRCCWRS